MKQAIFAPNYGQTFGDPIKVINLMKEAEKAGLYGFFLYDHVTEWYEMEETPNMHHPFSTLAACALVTSKIKLGTMVTPLNRRRPWIVARESLTIDQISGGRFILGVGIGVKTSKEFVSFNEQTNMKKRAAMLDEGLEILKKLWQGNEFSFEGKHYQLNEIKFMPKPVNHTIPIWVAGTWPNKKPFERAAKYNGVVPLKVGYDKLAMNEYRALVEYIESKKNPEDDFEYVVIRNSDMKRTNETAEELKQYKESGATLHFSTLGDSFGTYDQIKEFIQTGPRDLS